MSLRKSCKKVWSQEEDDMLASTVKKLGQTGWSNFTHFLPGRSGKQCRDRWFNHLRPMVKKGAWTQEEDRILFQCQQKFGNAWSKIAAEFLPGRTDLSVKNRFYSFMRKVERRERRMKNEISPRINSDVCVGSKRKLDHQVEETQSVATSSSSETSTMPIFNPFASLLPPAPTPLMMPNLSLNLELQGLLLQNLQQFNLNLLASTAISSTGNPFVGGLSF